MSRRSRRDDAAEAERDLDAVRTLLEEDLVALGEHLTELDLDVAGLPPAARVDLRTALEAYESAQDALAAMTRAEQVGAVNDTLAAGRFALARVFARVAGTELPTRRTPCFFDPRHGPSVRDVLWTEAGRGTRSVPACVDDAATLAAGGRPDLRTVRIGGRTAAAWEAGAAAAPYSEFWFSRGT